MLWNIIRDFIVQHITGGYLSDGSGSVGTIWGYDLNDNDIFYCDQYFVNVGGIHSGTEKPVLLPVGDWLATTITAVIMILLVVFAVWLVRWIFKAVSSAFLLK